MLRNRRDFFKPKVVTAPEPLREIPVRPPRMIHFFDPSNAKMAVNGAGHRPALRVPGVILKIGQ